MIHLKDFIIYFTFLTTYATCSIYCYIHDIYLSENKKANNIVITKNRNYGSI